LGELFSWWLFFYSPFNIPTYIPKSPINISGLSLIILITATIVFLQRKTLKFKRDISFTHLVLVGGLATFCSEIIFQAIRFQSILADTFAEKIYFALRGVIIITLLSVVISMISASFLKRKMKQS
jgi:hypothetical protein